MKLSRLVRSFPEQHDFPYGFAPAKRMHNLEAVVVDAAPSMRRRVEVVCVV